MTRPTLHTFTRLAGFLFFICPLWAFLAIVGD